MTKNTPRIFNAPCRFLLSVMSHEQLPDSHIPEIAFWGRSNCGKSSLINRLVNQTNLVRTGRTPGRTQSLNFFRLGEHLHLVDLPGYGYAQVSRGKQREFTALMQNYLQSRRQLRLVCLLIDSRRGLMDSDIEMMHFLRDSATVMLGVLTKADQIRKSDIDALEQDTRAQLQAFPNALTELFITSAKKNQGFAELQARLTLLIAQNRLT